ncbi:hypothetical protein CRENBAI_011503 [Crenichthys baileyi]|uniref:Uncharacterized protein n=1 Tax=Crenichthys baileyi TaxID=28760 RepID=A0AAV9QYJ7_9TELE
MVPHLSCVLLKPCGNIMHFYVTSVQVFTCTFMHSCTIPQLVPSLFHIFTYIHTPTPCSSTPHLPRFFSCLHICSPIVAERKRREEGVEGVSQRGLAYTYITEWGLWVREQVSVPNLK